MKQDYLDKLASLRSEITAIKTARYKAAANLATITKSQACQLRLGSGNVLIKPVFTITSDTPILMSYALVYSATFRGYAYPYLIVRTNSSGQREVVCTMTFGGDLSNVSMPVDITLEMTATDDFNYTWEYQ